MKKLSLIVLAAITAAGLAACDKKPGGATPSDGAVPTPSTTTQPAPAPGMSASGPAGGASG